MSNLALNKPVEEDIKRPEEVTNGVITGYTGVQGFGCFKWPGTLTVDLGECKSIRCVRVLLWDNDDREYFYRLLLSRDHNNWDVIFDSGSKGYKGWQVFNLKPSSPVRYIRIHGIYNSINPMFHVVEIEAHDVTPEALLVPNILVRDIRIKDIKKEIGDGQPIASKIGELVSQLEQSINNSNLIIRDPFQKLIDALRKRISDVQSIEQSMDAIRGEIVNPVKQELEKSSHLGRVNFWITFVCGVLAVSALVLQLIPLLAKH